MLLSGVPTKEYGNEGDEDWAYPGGCDHEQSWIDVHEVTVVERFDDGVEPVKRDGAEMKGANCTRMNIDRIPKITDWGPKNPPEWEDLYKKSLS